MVGLRFNTMGVSDGISMGTEGMSFSLQSRGLIADSIEAPWNIGEFYGSSYFCDPRGQIFAQASRDKDEVLTADLDLDKIADARKTWQFYRDRRPEMYGDLVKP
jgi:predicted amidohydrolase